MLIDFAITNFRSIKERQVFSMQTVSRITEKPDNTIGTSNEQLLRSAVIYGRNASGKSNLMLAADCLSQLIIKENVELNNLYRPFRILTTNLSTPTILEINFYGKNKIKYNLNISFDAEQIIDEYLFYYPEGKRKRLYVRNYNEIKTDISELKKISKTIYPYHTILSRLKFHKIDLLMEPYDFFYTHFVAASFIGDEKVLKNALEVVLNKAIMPSHFSNLEQLIRVADTGIDSIETKILPIEEFNLPDTVDEKTKQQIYKQNRFIVKFKHPVYENNNKIGEVEFELEDESTGTQKLLLFGSNMLDCLSDGDVLFVDELDKGLHPKLMQAIIRTFNNPKTNPNNAQLIFTTHDVSLLGANLFRRDQIWITEKDINGASSYYTIADIKGVRAEIPFEKYLLNGSFGGTPVINEFDFEFNLERTDEKL